MLKETKTVKCDASQIFSMPLLFQFIYKWNLETSSSSNYQIIPNPKLGPRA